MVKVPTILLALLKLVEAEASPRLQADRADLGQTGHVVIPLESWSLCSDMSGTRLIAGCLHRWTWPLHSRPVS